jgi:hypothetical protein
MRRTLGSHLWRRHRQSFADQLSADIPTLQKDRPHNPDVGNDRMNLDAHMLVLDKFLQTSFCLGNQIVGNGNAHDADIVTSAKYRLSHKRTSRKYAFHFACHPTDRAGPIRVSELAFPFIDQIVVSKGRDPVRLEPKARPHRRPKAERSQNDQFPNSLKHADQWTAGDSVPGLQPSPSLASSASSSSSVRISASSASS